MSNPVVGQTNLAEKAFVRDSQGGEQIHDLLVNKLLEKVVRPSQYLGNEWGAARRNFASARVHLAFAFPDLYELGMSNFGQRILYNIVNANLDFMADRSYALGQDMEELARAHDLPLWAWESLRPLKDFELVGFSLQYELTYTNVLNMLDLAGIPVLQSERRLLFPLVFGGGPSAVNPEPLADFMDFFVIGDGEEVVPRIMETIRTFVESENKDKESQEALRLKLLLALAQIGGVYVPSLYRQSPAEVKVTPILPGASLPLRIARQIYPLNENNQPTAGPVSYLSLVHDRQVLEVRRGCDRGCRFCQPGYTFLPVRERTSEDLLALSTKALAESGHDEYSLLSLCVSDYTALHETVRALNDRHRQNRASLSFPSQRADRMNLDIAEELKVVRKSGITLAPEAGTERLRAVINKGLSHGQIISAIESAYKSGWTAIKLYFMLGLPTETDEDLKGIIEILKEATAICRRIRRENPDNYRRGIEFTCTLSNFVPKPHTPFQWFGQIGLEETARRQKVLRDFLKESGLRNVKLNFTSPDVSMMETVISRGDRQIGKLVLRAWQKGATFDAWDDRFVFQRWQEAASELGLNLEELAAKDREVGSTQPWDIVDIGLNSWWLVKEWEKAMASAETPPCTENACHACGVCTVLDTTHQLAFVRPEQLKRNPFIAQLPAKQEDPAHPSINMDVPERPPSKPCQTAIKLRFQFEKKGDLRFISHLDLQNLLVRALRRAGISPAYTEGFNPSPKLSLAQALPLFQESEGEVGEVELSESINADEFMSRINAKLPPEVRIRKAKTTISTSSLASLVGRARYQAYVPPHLVSSLGADFIERLKKTISDISSAPSLNVFPEIPAESKKGAKGAKQTDFPKDIKPGVYALAITLAEPVTLEFTLASGSVMHVKPGDLLKLIDKEIPWRVSRLGLSSADGIPLFDLP